MGEPFKIASVNLFDAVLILWLAQDSGSGPGGAGWSGKHAESWQD